MFWIGALVGALFILFLEAGGTAYLFYLLDKKDKEIDDEDDE